jgi:hypothetical protein
MTPPDELQRAVERLKNAARNNDGTLIDKDYGEVFVCVSDLHLANEILSERAELLATVERLRGGLEGLVTAVCYADPPQNFARAGDEPNLCHVARVPVDFIAEARAALTTGEDK